MLVRLDGAAVTLEHYAADKPTGRKEQFAEKINWEVPRDLAIRRGVIAIRGAAARALGQIGPTANEAVPALIQSLKDPNGQVRCEVAWSLGRIGPAAAPAMPALVERLDYEDGEVRRYSAYARSLLGPLSVDAIPKLAERLQDEHMGYMAARALGDIGPAASDAIPQIIEALRKDSTLSRMEFAIALGKFGAEAKEAVPDLRSLLQDPDENVQGAAAKALQRIEQ